MRTDSTNLSQDALDMVRGYINDNFGAKYLPKDANVYSSKDNSQEAHEAIRPSSVDVLPESLKDMENDAKKVVSIDLNQFVACQMTPAKYDSTTLTVKAGDFELKAKGRTLRFDGWTKVMPALVKMMKTKRCHQYKSVRSCLWLNYCLASTYQAASTF